MTSRASVALLVLMAPVLSLWACSSVVSAPPPGTVPDASMRLQVQNGTNLSLELVVNSGTPVEVAPNSSLDLSAADLPALPWHSVVRFPNGRTLVELTVHSGDVQVGEAYARGDGARADLSCGRIDVWSGPQPLGPAPPLTFPPGDCSPSGSENPVG